ncbi:hypothetical protein [Microbacterium sp. H1-D42]|uniref:hypothetical protein n=1 Tax=Microbacterium sp. H1-D42 TaxID=2925844 RepID=UPI001F53640C|nr:hypothetical protein [Microbacterium sp. H1-D42]UNK70980.1 hypothetical protein MNR00_00625 [Microbacterium sp. H1-D42]
MYTIAHASPPAADGLWAAFAALRLLEEAEDRLASAEGVGAGLVADSAWRSDGAGARALRGALAELHRGLMGEVVAVQEQQGIVRAGIR